MAWVVARLPERAAAFAQEFGFAHHSTDLQHALQDPSVDAVFICTPSALHASQAAACLEAGKHALVEVPLAMSFCEARDLAERARSHGLALMVGHNHRYHEGVLWACDRILNGEVSPLSASARYFLWRRENVGSDGYKRSWTDNLLWHHGSHSMDILLRLLGVSEVDRVDVASVVATPDTKTGIPMDMTIIVRTQSDQLGTMVLSYNSFMNVYDYVLMGHEETFIIDAQSVRNREGIVLDYSAAGDRNRRLQNREFVAAIREGRQPSTSADSVLPTLDVLQQVQDRFELNASAS